MSLRHATIIAGPNGVGNSTLAPKLMAEFGVHTFLNADVIAHELNPEDVAAAAIQAGRIMHRRVHAVIDTGESFALETTLSGLSLRNSIARMPHAGYIVVLVFLWVPSPEINVQRVRGRVQLGGHHVPAEDIRRRYLRSIYNFERVYRRMVPLWRVHDARFPLVAGSPPLIAQGAGDIVHEIHDVIAWRRIQAQASEIGGIDDR